MSDSFSSTTSATLLKKLAQEDCDQQAWEAFTDRYGAKILAWCRRWGLQEADADDVTQDVLYRLCKQLRNFQYQPEKGKFRSWLQQVVRHAWSDFLKARERPGRGIGSDDNISPLESIPARDELVEQLENAYDLELSERAQQNVRQRVAAHTWEAFSLTQLDGISAAETAQKLNINVGTVYQAIIKVKKMLKEEVELFHNHDSEAPP